MRCASSIGSIGEVPARIGCRAGLLSLSVGFNAVALVRLMTSGGFVVASRSASATSADNTAAANAASTFDCTPAVGWRGAFGGPQGASLTGGCTSDRERCNEQQNRPYHPGMYAHGYLL